jgi:hypothetical protein
MYTALLFTLLIAFILWGLSKTTENVLAIRQTQREQGKKPIIFL